MTSTAAPPATGSGVTFLFSSSTGLPDQFLQGYVFDDADYVFGSGADDLHAATGRRIAPGGDGCYVTVSRLGDGHVVGVDGSGLKKIFYYSDGPTWCFSNSLTRLAEHLTAHGVRLSVSFPQLMGVKVRHGITAQQSTYQTFFNEVRLLPTRNFLHVDAAGLHVRTLPRPEPVDYPTALRGYLTSWTRRCATLLSTAGTQLTSDLTGGVDSRSIFALLHRTTELLDEPVSRVRFRSSTGEHWAGDLVAAGRIAHRYGFRLNPPETVTSFLGRTKETGRKLTGPERYTGWRDLCLGNYLSIYFPGRALDPWSPRFHGGGGGNHRPFYSPGEPEAFLAQFDNVKPTYLRAAWQAAMRECFDTLRADEPTVDPMVVHYREFRNRFHAGRDPQYGVVLAPLSSNPIKALSHHPDKVATRQIYFDVMESLLPGLLDLPYDDPKKAPSAQNHRDLTVVDVRLGEPGRVWIGADAAEAAPDGAGTSPFELLAEDLERSVRPLVVDFLGEKVVTTAREVVDAARRTGKLAHANDARDVTRLLTVGFALDAARVG